jgi:hypothetical protein
VWELGTRAVQALNSVTGWGSQRRGLAAEPRRSASDDELNGVREALALVGARGFNRGRRLGDDLTRALADTGR